MLAALTHASVDGRRVGDGGYSDPGEPVDRFGLIATWHAGA
jgi:hypothetical protein